MCSVSLGPDKKNIFIRKQKKRMPDFLGNGIDEIEVFIVGS
jgi:hypothetical protein